MPPSSSSSPPAGAPAAAAGSVLFTPLPHYDDPTQPCPACRDNLRTLARRWRFTPDGGEYVGSCGHAIARYVWVTNAGDPDSQRDDFSDGVAFLAHALGRLDLMPPDARLRMQAHDRGLVKGPPMPTPHRTSDELAAGKIIGLYRPA